MIFQRTKLHTKALTIIEVLVVITTALILAVVFLIPRRQSRLDCPANLRQIGVAFRVWAEDHNNKYPMSVSVTNHGGMELIDRGDLAGCLEVMSNELATPKVLICPADKKHVPAKDFGSDFDNSHVNYFVNLDADEQYPQELMCGDDNLAINGVPVTPGIVSSALPLSWTKTRHINVGNIGYADGSVAEVSNIGLQQAIILGTNGTPAISRFAIP